MSLFKNLNSNKFLVGTVSLILLFILILPIFTHARLINCGNGSTTTSIVGDGKVGGGCDFTDLIDTINQIINWIISIAGVIFTLSAIYGGFLYMTSGDAPGNKDKAKKILYGTALGFVTILCSWLIIYTLLTFLVPENSEYHDSIFRFIGTGN